MSHTLMKERCLQISICFLMTLVSNLKSFDTRYSICLECLFPVTVIIPVCPSHCSLTEETPWQGNSCKGSHLVWGLLTVQRLSSVSPWWGLWLQSNSWELCPDSQAKIHKETGDLHGLLKPPRPTSHVPVTHFHQQSHFLVLLIPLIVLLPGDQTFRHRSLCVEGGT